MQEIKEMLYRALRWQKNFRVSGAAKFQNTQDGCSISFIPVKPVQDVTGGKLPIGQYQYQTYQMVAQNEAGWDFDRLHPPVI